MRILVVTDRFVPEVTAVSVRTMEHAKIWQSLGHEVTIVTCAPNFPAGKVFPGYRNRLYQEEKIDGIRVIRLWSFMAPNEGVFLRIFDYASFMISVLLFCRRYPDFDVVIATSPPIFHVVTSCLVAHLRKRPWVFEVRDLWPAQIKAVGATSFGAFAIVDKLALFLYKDADRIVSLTHGFKKDQISRGVLAEKIDVITNGVDVERFHRTAAPQVVRKKLGIEADTFLAGYIGTVGMNQGLVTILDAAQICRNRPDISFLIMGEGAERRYLEEQARARDLCNLHFANFVPLEQVSSYWAALDLSIVHLKPDSFYHTTIPSKIFENMALGVPILLGVEGECADIVREAACGICVPPGDGAAMAEAITQLADDRGRLKEMQIRGLEVCRAKYDRKVLAREMLRSLEIAVSDHHMKRK